MCQFSDTTRMETETDRFARNVLKTLEATYSPTHRYVAADLRDFKHLDRKYYERTKSWLESEHFQFLADEQDETLANAPGNTLRRLLIRTMVSHDGHIQASFYHPRLKFWYAVLLFFFRVKVTKTIDLETEFSDGSFLVTSNAGAAASPMESPPTLHTEYLPQNTPPAKVLETHRIRLRAHSTGAADLRPLTIQTQAEMRASQNRQNAIKAAFRHVIGGMSVEELVKCGAKPADAAAIQQRIRELYAQ